MEWHEAYEKVFPYCVKIDSETGFGTGFLFAYNKNKKIAAIATAAHVVNDVNWWLKPLRIIHYESNSNILLLPENRAIWIDQQNRDAATIIVNAELLPFPATILPLLASNHHLKIGVEVGWAGFPAISPNNFCFFSGPISFFLENESTYLIDGVAINGVSGGPVFRKLSKEQAQPELVGIVSAYRANRRATDTLPGLLVAQDITPVHEHLQQMNSLDEAQEKAEKQRQEQKQQEAKPENSEGVKN
ncbi:MAG: trypsin-like peptidase domain-containing protein [Candidatus Omnitrophica bacterium]|nr:trypsin-like peptidase domain-containing protein [Candidatus Omnitrophota bacterium]